MTKDHKDPFSKEAIMDALRREGLTNGTANELTIHQYPGGYSNLTYRLEIGDQRYVLRRPPDGAVKRGHDMEREFRVLSGLKSVFDKVPTTYFYTDDKRIIGVPFYIMEEVEGVILHDGVAGKMGIKPEGWQRIADKWLDTFAELHQLDYKKAGLEELGRPDGYVERQVRNWSKQYLKAATEDIPTAKKVMEWMDSHQPKEYDHSLIHNDYKYNNIVFADDSWQEIKAVLDWEMCTIGDPLMDLGTSLGYWVTADDHETFKTISRAPTVHEGNPSRRDVVEAYTRKTGREVKHLTFYYVFGLFKIAVIVQQIYYRYQAGYTQDPRFANLNHFTRLLCDTAWNAVQRDRID